MSGCFCRCLRPCFGRSIAGSARYRLGCALDRRPSQLTVTPQAGFLPQYHSYRHKTNNNDLSSLIEPLPYTKSLLQEDEGIDIGAELTSFIKKEELLRMLNQFYRRPEIKKLAAEKGIDNRLFHQAYISFRKFCVETETLPVQLHIVLSDITQKAGHVDDIFPYFLQHAMEIFPHLDCMEDLQKISDLRQPANWYPEARAIRRKIIFHAGPTNSGKTYHALERFLTANSGVYCGPLKLLASEVFHKSNTAGTLCDLVTGEERRYSAEDGSPSNHVACTVEMTSVTNPYDVAIIDEIQMIKDPQRGWAWTRALLGVCAHEVHICGEASAIDLVKELMVSTGDEVEIRRYTRLTKLSYLNESLNNFDNVRPGDCFVCFSKNDIYHISRQLEKRSRQCAVIYGGLPPGTKLAQAQKFNDPDDPCKVMVATDAIGMGLNLSINRIIFYSLIKPKLNEKGEKELDLISTSQALQIGGRAGRYGTKFEEGKVTTFKREDLNLLKDITSQVIEPIEQAGLHPTAEQIELFAYHLPKATLSNLIDIFVTLSQLDSDKYFMCNVDEFKFLADMIEHVPLQLRVRYVFCCAPIPKKQPFVCTMFLKFARQFSRSEPLTVDWLCRQLDWPYKTPCTIMDLVHLEGVFDVLDLYLWLSYRFHDMIPDTDAVRVMQSELDTLIQKGVINITKLLKTSRDNAATNQIKGLDLTKELEIPEEFDPVPVEQPPSMKERFKSAKDNMAARQNSSQNQHRVQSAGLTSKKAPTGQGRLTDSLIKQGLLTKEMVQKLQEEWSSDVISQNNNRNGRNKRRKR